MGLAQGLWKVPIPRWCYGVVIAAFLVAASYEAWLKEYRLRRIAERERRIHAGRDWSAEWKGLADRFHAVSPYIRASWQRGGMGVANGEAIEGWHLGGAASTPEVKQCEALCSFAGELLKQSPKMNSRLTPNTLKQTDAIERWLTFLMETHRVMSITSDYAIVPDTQGENKIILVGTIEKVASVSATACIACATAEI
jgi:hypothetical protein